MRVVRRMEKVYVTSHWAIGNTGIQLSVACILAERFGYPKIVALYEDDLVVNIERQIGDDLWALLHPFLDEPKHETFQKNICVSGYFQDSEPLVRFRETVLKRLWAEADFPIGGKGGPLLRDLLHADAPMRLTDTDIVMHIRLGDFVGAKMVIDPAPQIAILREIRRKEPVTRIVIVCAKPSTDVEKNYLLLFEEFAPVFQHGTEAEDFATLRSARRIIVTNSTFSWFAAYVGNAKERWIPVPKYNALGKISETDILYDAAEGYNTAPLAVNDEPMLPVTGEFLQAMCDYSVLNRAKKEEYHKWIDVGCPPARQLFIEDEWPAAAFEARTLFIYPTTTTNAGRHVFKYTWPNLRLIIFHNSDYGVDYDALVPFLEKNPLISCWAQNATRWHPRIKCVPIGEENRMWRGGSADYEPPVQINRGSSRPIEIMLPYCRGTHPIRYVWYTQAVGISRIQIFDSLARDKYLNNLSASKAVICPPGNGVDTHRHWETVLKGAWAIVEDNAHTQTLLRDYPSLPFIPIQDISDLKDLEIPGPPPFHPLILREYWRVLFRSYLKE